jgi:peptide/nickel transport system substrate-binding protein
MPVKMDLETGSMELVPNPNWWGPAPKLSKINYFATEDGAAALIMMKKGEGDVNMASDLPTTFDELGPDYVGTNIPATPVLQYFWINSNVAPMDDINCRKAMIMAANPAELFKSSHPHGPGEFGTTLLKQLLHDKEINKPVTNDIEGAKAAFALCKYKDAMPKIYVAGTTNPQAEVAAQTLVEQWRQVLGIQESELVPAMDKLPKSEQNKVQFFRDDVGTRVFDATTLLLGSVHSKSGNAQGKMGGYKNDAIDKLIDEASALPPSDPTRDLKALEAEKLAIEDYVFIPWYDEGPTMHAMPWVLNYSRNIDWQIVEPWNLDIDLSKRP